MTGRIEPVQAASSDRHARLSWRILLVSVIAFAILLALGTWQLQRLAWKEALIATIDQRIASAPTVLQDIEALYARTGDVDYWPVAANGEFLNDSERHFLATHDGQAGFYVYTPLRLEDRRILFVNRGFVPYDRKEASTRPQSLPAGAVTVTGLARNPLPEKPSFIVPENDLGRNVFYWKDLSAMATSAELPDGATVLPFFVDAGATQPGVLPVGGVTIIDQPNNHLQYALTWYGLAAALAAVVASLLWRRDHPARMGEDR